MNLRAGDRVTFGPVYCEEMKHPELSGRTLDLISMTGESESSRDGETNKDLAIDIGEGPQTLHDLFGPELEHTYDCVVTPGSPEGIEHARRIHELEEVIDPIGEGPVPSVTEMIIHQLSQDTETDSEGLHEIKIRMEGLKNIPRDEDGRGVVNIDAIEFSMKWLIERLERKL